MLSPLFLLAAACTNPEAEASAASVKYLSAPLDDIGAAHGLACADEQTANPLANMQADADRLKATAGDKWAEVVAARKARTYAVKSVTVAETKVAATVLVTVSDATTGAKDSTVEMRRDGDRWCVVTGWAEAKRIIDETTAAAALASRGMDEALAWQMEEATASMAEARTKYAALPQDNAIVVAGLASLESAAATVAERKARWVGGRWSVSKDVDAMTDAVTATAALQSIDGLPNMLGKTKPATLIIRCGRDGLDVYITTDSMLDYDYRSDTVRGQHRFGAAPAESLVGGASEDRKAIFLRKPAQWLGAIKAHEAEKWIVELPLYQRLPAAVTFDLSAASAALAALPPGCA